MQHFNPTISQDLNRLLNLKGESTSEVADVIQPVVNIQRFCNICRHGSATGSGTITVYTTPSDKDFYLSSFSVSLIKDVACDVASGSIGLATTIEGVVRGLGSIAIITLTAQEQSITASLPIPVKIDRGVTIQIGGTFAAGSMIRYGTIQGYTVETTKGV